jgi:hypothetical protein
MKRAVLALAVLAVAGLALPGRSEGPHPRADEKVERVGPAPVRLKLGQRTAVAEGHTKGLGHNSAPLIEVVQPQPNVVVVTVTGLSVVGGLPCEASAADIAFDLLQAMDIITAVPGQRVKLTMEAQLAGLFRGNREGAGAASTSPAEATVAAGGAPLLNAGFPGQSHSGKDLMLVSLRSPACEAVVLPGEIVLCQKFAINCAHPKKCFHKNVMMAAFGPETGRAPEWVALLDPTREIPKQRDFGFRVLLRADPAP